MNASAEDSGPIAREDIKNALSSFLDRLEVPYARRPYDWEFHKACVDMAQKLNYPFYLQPPPPANDVCAYLPFGVNIVSMAYRHLKDKELQITIAFLTAFVSYIDDWSSKEGEPALTFTKRLVLGQAQEGQLFASLHHAMRRLYRFYDASVADLITASIINGVSSMGMENRWSSNVMFQPRSAEFATYFRNITGISDGFSIWLFPPSLPLEGYIEVIPDIATMFGFVNDLLSFYKEEQGGDTLNYISLEAKRNEQPKIEIFRTLADEVIVCHKRVLRAAEAKDPRVKEAYLAFITGYVDLHLSSCSRYHLDELLELVEIAPIRN